MGLLAALWLPLFVIPALTMLVDVIAPVRARLNRRLAVLAIDASTEPCRDYTLIVPIYGDMRYLQNEDYLRQYGDRVMLTTSSAETASFYAEFQATAHRNGFRTFVAPCQVHATDGTSRRQIGGTLRDTIVRGATRTVTDTFVVCIDADTVTTQPVDLLVGRFAEAGLDLGSVPLVPANRQTLLGRLQAHEYRIAMRLRRIMPWLVSGGCHIARADVHKDLMNAHSLFFQGNDVELGLIASSRGYRIGHILFEVPTEVPDTLRSWWRQRKAWAGGEFRLMVVNVRHAWRHPFLFLYGAVVVFALLPVRYLSAIEDPSWALLSTLALYGVLLAALNWEHRDRALLLYPLYAAFSALVLVPVGCITYVQMAVKHRNAGIILSRRPRPEPVAA
jgi:cellulose synthase/poly-beta-1,6-N-acetylglucosamine synthase-like glycosyltransferase